MTKRSIFLYPAIVAICFLYVGSVYMSQFYRLMDVIDGEKLDIITSCGNYLCQAAGIIFYMIGLKFAPKIFGSKKVFAGLLAAGSVFMLLSQLSSNTNIIIGAGYAFNIHTGLCFGFYLSLFAAHACIKYAATLYGIAYAVGSLGTYLLSLPSDGEFLKTGTIAILYGAFALVTVILVLLGDSLPEVEDKTTDKPAVAQLSVIVVIMTVISVIGSGLYYSLPQAADVNWNLIRCFYAAGLILTGIVMDKGRRIGEIVTAVSLVYPLIVIALIGEGVTGTVTMGLSYFFRGCLTIYYIISFTDFFAKERRMLYLAPLGLCLSRITEALISYIVVRFHQSNLANIIITALFFVPLIVMVIIRQTASLKKSIQNIQSNEQGQMSDAQRMAHFAESYKLTAREAEILNLIREGLTDDEISTKINISRNTVRFHVSNILKKTSTASRVEAARAVDTFKV